MDERQLMSLSTTQIVTATALPEPTLVDNMQLTRRDIEECILIIITAIVMTNIAERISHRYRQTRLDKCSESIDLSQTLNMCSVHPDLTVSHFT